MADEAPRLLSRGQLERLERVWRQQRVPILECLQPGLTHDEMDTICAPLGVRLTDEARTWWGWHNGGLGEPPGQNSINAIRYYTSLQSAVQATIAERQATLGVVPWPPGWIKISGGPSDIVLLDVGGDPHGPTPVHTLDVWVNAETADVSVLASLGDLVENWIASLQSGLCRYIAAEGRWHVEDMALDPGLRERFI
jgi:hypothetical protein